MDKEQAEVPQNDNNEIIEGSWAQRYKQQLESSNSKKNRNNWRNQKNEDDEAYEFQNPSHQVSFNQPLMSQH